MGHMRTNIEDLVMREGSGSARVNTAWGENFRPNPRSIETNRAGHKYFMSAF